MKHTKGPWFAIDYAGTFTLQSGPYYGDTSLLDYNEFHDSPTDDKEEAEANALLASKSPEMLEALKRIIDCQNDKDGTLEFLSSAIFDAEILLKELTKFKTIN